MIHGIRSTAVAAAIVVAGLTAGTLWGTSASQRAIEQAVNQNFVAAELLSRLQVEGEKMRRYEKEMFIYVADSAKREGYVKEFSGAHDRSLALMNEMLLPSSPAFTVAEREQLLQWKEALVFYTAEFDRLARKAASERAETMNTEQRLGLTVGYNNAIKDGKDRFRVLLGGTDKMRTAKQDAARNIAREMDSTFRNLRIGVVVGGLLAVALVLLGREQPGTLASRAQGSRNSVVSRV